MDKKRKSVIAVAAALVVLAGAGVWLLYPRNQDTVPVMNSADVSESTSSVAVNIKDIVSVTEAPPESTDSSQAQTRTITLGGELHGDVQLPVTADPQDIPPDMSRPEPDSEPEVPAASESPYLPPESTVGSSSAASSAAADSSSAVSSVQPTPPESKTNSNQKESSK